MFNFLYNKHTNPSYYCQPNNDAPVTSFKGRRKLLSPVHVISDGNSPNKPHESQHRTAPPSYFL